MKKIYTLLFVMLLALSLSACGDVDTPVENSVDSEATDLLEQEASEETSGPADDVRTEDDAPEDNTASETDSSVSEAPAETSGPVSDVPYVFEAYDESGVTFETRYIQTDEGSKGDLTVYIVPKGIKNYVEIYQDGIVVNLVHLVDKGSIYSVVGMGALAGDDIWVAAEHALNAGERYDITMNEPGMWLYQIYDKNTAEMTYFCFEVQAGSADEDATNLGSVNFGQEDACDGEAVYHGQDIYKLNKDGTKEVVISEGDIVFGYLNLEDGTFQISKKVPNNMTGDMATARYTVEIATGKVKGSIINYW